MRVLGLDIGSTAVRGVEIDTAFGRYELHDYHEVKVPEGVAPQQMVAELIARLPRKPDKVCIAVPSSESTFRNLELPTRDKRALAAAVSFELEDDLPFDIESALFHHAPIAHSKTGHLIHIAATLKTHMTARLAGLAEHGVDPDAMTTEAWAYRALCNQMLKTSTQTAPVMIVHIGAKRSTTYVHWKGQPVVAREISWGSEEINRTIERRYNISPFEAEKAKIENGFVLSQSQKQTATADQIEFSDVISESLQKLFQEVRLAALTCKNITREKVGMTFVTGGGSTLPGLKTALQEVLAIDTVSLQALSAISQSSVTYADQTEAVFALAAATALAFAGPERGYAINLRQGDFAKKSVSQALNWKAIKRPAIQIGIVLACFLVSNTIQRGYYEKKNTDLDEQLERGVRTFFGQLSKSNIRSYLGDLPKLRKDIKRDLDQKRAYGEVLEPNKHSPLDFLKKLSSQIPRALVVDMTHFQVGAAPEKTFDPKAKGDVQLTFLVSEPGAADRMGDALAKLIAKPERSNMEQTTDLEGKGKRWKITFKGPATEVGYGN